MNGDITRDTFNRANHYDSVRLQQGRVGTDADWNEQADITRYRAERQAEDIIGGCGAPIHAAGFGLTAATYPLAVSAISGSPAGVLVVGEDGVVLRTVNDGVNWQIINVPVTANLRAVHFVGSTGWAVGDSGTILKTIDGGQSWQAQNSGVTVALHGISAMDALGIIRVWAVGDGGLIVSTNNGGTSWSDIKLGSSRLTAVHFLDASVGVAVGHGGVILRTVNGGATWNKININDNSKVDLYTLTFVGAVGWAAGEDGKIFKSTDQGQSWAPLNIPTKRSLRGIAFGDTNTGWIVGDGGIALHTTDGGSNWNQQDLGTSVCLRGVSFSSNHSGRIVGDDSLAIHFGTGSPGYVVTKLPGSSFSIEPGRLYAHGTLCELDRRSAYYNQPDRGRLSRLPAGLYLVYLNAWQRHISHLEAPGIREVALGGVDTATRTKTTCQVKTLPLPIGSPSTWNCLSEIAAWTNLIAQPKARLRARSEPQLATSNVCEIAAAAGYRRLENQLYRVEVHEGTGRPTFKWSRENGSVSFPVESLTVTGTATVVRLAARGRDDNLDVATGDCLEIIDDDAALEQRVGVLLDCAGDGNDVNEVVLAGALADGIGGKPSRHPVLRRWEQKPAPIALPIEEGKWIELEDGVQIWFEPGGSYRPGDYWLIPARTITGDVEWPRDNDGEPEARPPAGIKDEYCRLGIIEVHVDGHTEIVSDCRDLFPPLTALRLLLYVSGDGQDGIPGAELPQPLVVRVARGEHPVEKARVRFQIEKGNGFLAGSPALKVLETDTNLEGVASCRWSLDADIKAAARYQRVRASLVNAAGEASQSQALVFCATGTLSLQYVSGDGQEAEAGRQVSHPLEVRVANGQTPIPNARVRFTGEGGGQLVGNNPALTDANGIAKVIWRLGAGGAQRVRAELIDTANNVVQYVAFHAELLKKSTSGCAITIGEPDGVIGTLHTKALIGLIDSLQRNEARRDDELGEEREHRVHLCLCFLPGEHTVPDLKLSVPDLIEGLSLKKPLRLWLSIHGCGDASMITLRSQTEFAGIETIELSNAKIFVGTETGIHFKECDRVRVSNTTIEYDEVRANQKTPVLHFTGGKTVELTNSAVGNRNLKTPGLAVVFDDAEADVQCTNNTIHGVLSFYGDPPDPLHGLPHYGNPLKRILSLPEEEAIYKRLLMKEDNVKETHTSLVLSGNRLRILTIGAQKLQNLEEYGTGKNTLNGIFSNSTITSNTIIDRESLFVSNSLVLGQCSMLLQGSENPSRLGTYVTRACAVTGNVGPKSEPPIPLVIISPANFAEAGNALFIRH